MHYSCKKEPCKRRKKNGKKKQPLPLLLVVKGKKGKKKRPLSHGGLEPTPSLDGDGYGWWH